MPYTKEHRQHVAKNAPRDSRGHFAKKSTDTSDNLGSNLLKHVIPGGSTIHNTTDDNTLIDVHVGNPLKRITQILEQIKQQKAFSFDIKGSLGLVGVGLVVAGFGIFGGSQILCDKGIQTEMGTIKVLAVEEESDSIVPYLWPFINWYSSITSPVVSPKRIILVHSDNTIVHIAPNIFVNAIPSSAFINTQVFATGKLNSCTDTLTIDNREGIERAE